MGTLRNDLGIYERHAGEWWDADSAFSAPLHGLCAIALAQVRERLGARLAGARVIDLGCGGGLAAEPLARAGARVIGVDLGACTLRAARAHGAAVAGLSYVRADAVGAPLADGCADLVLCADALEHIPDWRALVATAARLLAPGGLFAVLTLNRTWRARWLGVHLAEGLRLVPRGTHDPAMFIRPDELAACCAGHGLAARGVSGVRPRLWRTLCRWRLEMAEGASPAVMYSAWFAKPGACGEHP